MTIKMKYKGLLMLMFLCLFASCSDFLEEKPVTSVKQEDAYKDEVAVHTALIGCYANFANNSYRGQLYELQQCISLSSLNSTSSAATSVLDAIAANTTTPDILASVYQQIYRTLDHVNIFIEQMEKSDFNERFISQNIGEAKFLRACAYFDLVRLYGRAPLKTKPTTNQDVNGYPREKISAIYALILQDLLDAEKTMKTPDEQAIGYPTYWAATAYLAKVYSWIASMTPEHMQATYEEGKDADYSSDATVNRFFSEIKSSVFPSEAGTADAKYYWGKSKDAAGKIYTSNVYQLQPVFGDLFMGKTRNTHESIFELQYSFMATSWGTSISSRTSPDRCTEFNPNMNNGASGRVCADWSTFAEHWRRYGDKTTYTKNRMFVTAKEALSTNYKAKPLSVHPYNFNDASSAVKVNPAKYDPRIDASYVYYSYMRYTENPVNSGVYDIGPSSQTCFPQSGFGPNTRGRAFPFIKKHLDYTQTSSSGSNINFIVYRYADLLLTYAEALNELGETDDAISLINNTILYRARNSRKGGASVEPQNWVSGLSQDSVRALIVSEREIELLGEGHETFEFRKRGWKGIDRRIQTHDFWYSDPDYGIRYALRNSSDNDDNTLRAFTHGEWDKLVVDDMGEQIPALRVYKFYYPYKSDVKRFCTKHLFLPVPQKELDTNKSIPFGDQNFGW